MKGTKLSLRRRELGGTPLQSSGNYVLYWMTANRRLSANFALDEAVACAREVARPLVILEALRCDYPYASERFHSFVVAGMAEHAHILQELGIRYLAYVEPRPGAGRGLVQALAEQAVLVVTDDHPSALYQRQIDRVAQGLRVPMWAVDSCGILPLQSHPKAFSRAFDFRRFAQRALLQALDQRPSRTPLRMPDNLVGAPVAAHVLERWPMQSLECLQQPAELLRQLPIDHQVTAVTDAGGSRRARARLASFLSSKIKDYAKARQHPDANVESGLSPYLHFGQISPHEILDGIVKHEGMPTSDLEPLRNSDDESTAAHWGLPAGADAFFDQVLVWRELALNMARYQPKCDHYDSLPDWARRSLAAHGSDLRSELYPMSVLERGETSDELWNAAQRQLRNEGTIHNYLRMLWGKKVLQWSPTPQVAWDRLLLLNDRYALDGRDPNTYANIGWVFGRFDRPWAPQRPIFGSVRYMTSESARRKLKLKAYLARWGSANLNLLDKL